MQGETRIDGGLRKLLRWQSLDPLPGKVAMFLAQHSPRLAQSAMGRLPNATAIDDTNEQVHTSMPLRRLLESPRSPRLRRL